jgi:hypothetical protein
MVPGHALAHFICRLNISIAPSIDQRGAPRIVDAGARHCTLRKLIAEV